MIPARTVAFVEMPAWLPLVSRLACRSCGNLNLHLGPASRVWAVQNLTRMRLQGRWQSDVWGIVTHFEESKKVLEKRRKGTAKIWLSRLRCVTCDEQTRENVAGPGESQGIHQFEEILFLPSFRGPMVHRLTFLFQHGKLICLVNFPHCLSIKLTSSCSYYLHSVPFARDGNGGVSESSQTGLEKMTTIRRGGVIIVVTSLLI